MPANPRLLGSRTDSLSISRNQGIAIQENSLVARGLRDIAQIEGPRCATCGGRMLIAWSGLVCENGCGRLQALPASEYERLSHTFPELVIGYAPVSRLYFSLDWKDIADYTEAIKLNPRDARRYLDRANAYLDLFRRQAKEETDEETSEETEVCAYALYCAFTDFAEAIWLEPEFAEAYRDRGEAHLEKGDLDSAIVDFAEAIQLDPNYAVAYYGRGEAYQKRGDRNEAKLDFDRAKRLGLKPRNRIFDSQVSMWDVWK